MKSIRQILRGKLLLAIEKLSPVLPDKFFIVVKYRLMLGRYPNLKNPRSLNEIIQAVKLYDRNPLYTTLVDKAAVKDYVIDRIGSEYVIPSLGIWSTFDTIDFDTLPDSFVLKCTHDSGSVIIVRDKSQFDKTAARKLLSAALNRDYSCTNHEWPYRDVPRKIIAEPFLENLSGATDDYKFFCSDGKVRFLFVATNRFKSGDEVRFDFFDRNWNHLPLKNGHPNADTIPLKPDNYEEMVSLAQKLSEGLHFVRVDLYNLDGHILFGEYTFSHWGGFKAFEPDKWDYLLGEMLKDH